ncbi:transposase [Stutzerimonas stutzeri]|nr:transposase [Stutzerimonas stutzeri]
MKHAWLESSGVFGYRKIHDDLRELSEPVAGTAWLA